MKQIQENILKTLKLLILLFIVSVGITYVSAWSGPPGAPFTCPAGHAGCDGPLHIGGTNQTKTGGLTVEGSLWGGGLYTNGGGYFGGNVGIKNTAPAYPLHVIGTSGSYTSGYFGSVNLTANRLTVDHSANSGVGFNIGGGLKWSAATYRPSGTNYDFALNNDQTSTPSLFIDGDTNNIGLGTPNPTAKLDVQGTTKTLGLQIPTSAAAGRVLTSDASGNATWQAPATGGGPKIVSGHDRNPSTCTGTLSGGFCNVLWSQYVSFPIGMFTVAPHVLVSIESTTNDAMDCALQANDLVKAYPENITRTGFTLRAGMSPFGNNCGAAEGYLTIRVGYIAIGN